MKIETIVMVNGEEQLLEVGVSKTFKEIVQDIEYEFAIHHINGDTKNLFCITEISTGLRCGVPQRTQKGCIENWEKIKKAMRTGTMQKAISYGKERFAHLKTGSINDK